MQLAQTLCHSISTPVAHAHSHPLTCTHQDTSICLFGQCLLFSLFAGSEQSKDDRAEPWCVRWKRSELVLLLILFPETGGEITLRVSYTSSTTSDKSGLKDKLKYRFVDYWLSLCVSVTRNFGPPPTFSSWTWRSVTSLWQSHSHPFSSWTPFTRGGFLVKQVFYSHEGTKIITAINYSLGIYTTLSFSHQAVKSMPSVELYLESPPW